MINLLIVEDDPMVAELNRRYVDTIEGYRIVAIAKNGEDALRYLEVKEVDLLLLDVYMPRMNGLELLRHIRNKAIWVDVILVTASKEAENVNELLKLGAVDYLIKPFSYERLKEALDNYRKRFELLSQSREVTQDEIDKITNINHSENNLSLQKGLHKHTLESIREYLNMREDELVLASDIAQHLKVSSVTIRRYLEYLIAIGEIKLEIEYGSIGRPMYKYKKIN